MIIKRHLVRVAVPISMFVAAAVNAASPAFEEMEFDIGVLQTSVNNIIAADQSNMRISPPLTVGPGQPISCIVANVTSVNQRVRVEQLKWDGSVAFTFTHDPILPGQALPLTLQGDQNIIAPRWCRFVVIGGSRTAIRASISLEAGVTSLLPVTMAAE